MTDFQVMLLTTHRESTLYGIVTNKTADDRIFVVETGQWAVRSEFSTIRPLVLVDPDHDEQLKKFLSALNDRGWLIQDEDSIEDVRNAFHTLGNYRVDIDEPKSLGSRVVDRKGRFFIRAKENGVEGRCWIDTQAGSIILVSWDDIDVIEVIE